MRSVKFRVWTGDRMIEPGDNDTALWIDGDKWELLSHFTGSLRVAVRRPEGTPVNNLDQDCRLMQYLGINDVIGAEIYEDDIVLSPTHPHFPYKRKCRIGVLNGSVYLSPFDNTVGDYLVNFKLYGRLEVLGNIHEHKISIAK